jgi:hypothetical protein
MTTLLCCTQILHFNICHHLPFDWMMIQGPSTKQKTFSGPIILVMDHMSAVLQHVRSANAGGSRVYGQLVRIGVMFGLFRLQVRSASRKMIQKDGL